MGSTKRFTVVALGAAALLTGCGGGEPATITDRDAVLRVELTEYRLQPPNVRVQATSVPMRVQLVAHNGGKLTHNLKIESVEPEAEQGTSVQPTVYGGTDTAQPGATVAADVFLQPGTYRMTCTLANHDNLGQYGKLIVEAPQS